MAKRSQYLTIAAITILAASLAATYVTTSNEIAGVKQASLAMCKQYEQAAVNFTHFAGNLTTTLQSQIQNDRSLVAILNSTKPAGYEGAIASIDAQISQDNSIMAWVASQFQATSLPQSDSCFAFES